MTERLVIAKFGAVLGYLVIVAGVSYCASGYLLGYGWSWVLVYASGCGLGAIAVWYTPDIILLVSNQIRKTTKL